MNKLCSSKTTLYRGEPFFTDIQPLLILHPYHRIFSMCPHTCTHIRKLHIHIAVLYYVYCNCKTHKYEVSKYKTEILMEAPAFVSCVPARCPHTPHWLHRCEGLSCEGLSTRPGRGKNSCAICVSVIQRGILTFPPLLIILSLAFICLQSIHYVILRL